MRAPTRQQLLPVSPIAVIALGHATARLCAPHLGVWTWVPLMLVYWSAMLAVALWSDALGVVLQAFRRPSGVGWWTASLLAGLVPLPILLRFHFLLRSPGLTACWLVIALLNPFFEEGYWRALLGEATKTWPGWVACGYSSLLFAASHPLMWGVFSLVNRRPDAALSLFLLGLLWSANYRRKQSLQAPVVSHMLVDLGNLSVSAFMNLFSPAGWR